MAAKKTIKLERIGSTIGRVKSQEDTLIALRLGKRHRISELQDTPEIRGMIRKVQHLVKIIEG